MTADNVKSAVLPVMGEGIHEARVNRWLRSEGDMVGKDEPLVEVSTDKVDTEVVSPYSGVLTKIVAQADQVVATGGELAQITVKTGPLNERSRKRREEGEEEGSERNRQGSAARSGSELESERNRQGSAARSGSELESERNRQGSAARSGSELESERNKQKSEARSGSSEREIRASPLVRRMAKERGIDLTQVTGSGLHGRIVRRDVEKRTGDRVVGDLTAQTDGQEYLDGVTVRRERMSRMRCLIAEHMSDSVRISPHVTTVFEVDVERIMEVKNELEKEFQQQEGLRLTLTPFFIHVVATCLQKFPILNVSLDGRDILWKDDINIGCAVALEHGLIVPVIRRADRLGLLGIAQRLQELVVRARGQSLAPDAVRGGTFTVTNPGIYGSLTSNPIINQPQVAILGLGNIVSRTVVVDGMIAIRRQMLVSLTFDHRVVDGETGAKFLALYRDIAQGYTT